MIPYYESDTATLYHGDALQLLQSLPDASVDALVTDPPYSSGGMTRADRSSGTVAKYVSSQNTHRDELVDFGGDNRDQRAYAYWCALWLGEAMRVTKPQGVALLFTDWRQLPATTDAIQSGGWIWRGIVPWYKPSSRPQAGRFSAACEYVVWGSRGGMINDLTAPCLPGFFQASSPRDREHITQKPLTVMRELVKIAPPGGIILDPFAGSCTTGVAALNEGRRFIGSEQIKHYADIGAKNLAVAGNLTVDRGEQGALDLIGTQEDTA